MQLNKHQIIKDIYDAMGMVEELGCSDELTALSVKLGAIGDDVEKLVDEIAISKVQKERTCETCMELLDDEICDKCGNTILTTKDAYISIKRSI